MFVLICLGFVMLRFSYGCLDLWVYCVWVLGWFSLSVCWFGLWYAKLFVLLLMFCFVIVGLMLFGLLLIVLF